VDPDAVAPQAPTRVSVTLNEYGNATLATRRLEATAFTNADQELSVIVGRNMVDTIDGLIQAVADTSTNGLSLQGGALTGGSVTTGSVTSTDVFSKKLGSAAVTKLRDDKVIPVDGEKYLIIAHPDVLFDLMAENSANSWVAAKTYGGDTGDFYNGYVGTLAGAHYLESVRVTTATDGPTSQKVYRSYAFGKQAIAEAVAIDPHIVVGPVVDKLKRFSPLGWYGMLGWSLYRPQALRKIYTQSSISAVS
jgi:N4-gp56 family major capsid protein